MENFLIGVLASVVAAVIIALVVKFAWPTFQNCFLYNGIQIAGTWEIFEQRDGKTTKAGQIKLAQTGRMITGESVRSKTRGGKKANREFEYRGHIHKDQVTLLFEDTHGVGFDSGSYVFIVQNNRLEMEGMATFQGKFENKIVSEPRTLKKIPN